MITVYIQCGLEVKKKNTMTKFAKFAAYEWKYSVTHIFFFF